MTVKRVVEEELIESSNLACGRNEVHRKGG